MKHKQLFIFAAFLLIFCVFPLNQGSSPNTQNDVPYVTPSPAVTFNPTNQSVPLTSYNQSTANYNYKGVGADQWGRGADGNYKTNTSDAWGISGNPSGWTTTETGGVIDIVASYLDHSYPVSILDTSTNGPLAIEKTFPVITTANIPQVSFWYVPNPTTRRIHISDYDIGVMLLLDFSAAGVFNSYYATGLKTVTTLPLNVWSFIRIVCINAGEHQIYVNEALQGTFINYANMTTLGIDAVNIKEIGTTQNSAYPTYVDALYWGNVTADANATWGLKNPSLYTRTESGCSIAVDPGHKGHTYPINFQGTSAPGTTTMRIENTYTEVPTAQSPQLSFWYHYDGLSTLFYWKRTAASANTLLLVLSTIIENFNGATWATIHTGMTADNWYFLRFKQTSATTYNLYVNEALIGGFTWAGSSPTGMGYVYLHRQWTATVGSLMLDGIYHGSNATAASASFNVQTNTDGSPQLSATAAGELHMNTLFNVSAVYPFRNLFNTITVNLRGNTSVWQSPTISIYNGATFMVLQTLTDSSTTRASFLTSSLSSYYNATSLWLRFDWSNTTVPTCLWIDSLSVVFSYTTTAEINNLELNTYTVQQVKITNLALGNTTTVFCPYVKNISLPVGTYSIYSEQQGWQFVQNLTVSFAYEPVTLLIPAYNVKNCQINTFEPINVLVHHWATGLNETYFVPLTLNISLPTGTHGFYASQNNQWVVIQNVTLTYAYQNCSVNFTPNLAIYSEESQIVSTTFNSVNLLYTENFTGWNTNYEYVEVQVPSETSVAGNDTVGFAASNMSYVGWFYVWYLHTYVYQNYYRYSNASMTRLANIWSMPAEHVLNTSYYLEYVTGLVNATVKLYASNQSGAVQYFRDYAFTTYGYYNITYPFLQDSLQFTHGNVNGSAIFTDNGWSWNMMSLTVDRIFHNSSQVSFYDETGNNTVQFTKSFVPITTATGDTLNLFLEADGATNVTVQVGNTNHTITVLGTQAVSIPLTAATVNSISIYMSPFARGRLILRAMNITHNTAVSGNFILEPQAGKLVYLPAGTYSVVSTFLNGEIIDQQLLTVIGGTIQNLFIRNQLTAAQVLFYDPGGDVIPFETFRTYLTKQTNNASVRELMPDAHFNAPTNSPVFLEVYDRFGRLLVNETHTVETFIDITIPVYSLKFYNQQPFFNYINVTTDPATSTIWSEWMAPGEIVEYNLYPGNYLLTLSSNENSSTTVYSFALVGDDIFLLTSQNTLANVIANILNTNATLGNQILNVEINVTNQNSGINSQIVNLNLNLNNVNSSIGDLLLYTMSNVTAVGNNITTLYYYSQTGFMSLQNNINFSFVELNASVWLVNNSIYTGVNALSASLSNINNTVAGNLTWLIQFSPELTAIYTNTLFAENLTWSSDPDVVRAQTELYTILNNYRNQSAELQVKYGTEIKSFYLGAQDTFTQAMLNYSQFPMQYRVIDASNGQLLEPWKPVTGKNISVGFYDEVVPATPDQIRLEIKDYLMMALFGVVICAVIAVLYLKTKADLESIPESKRKKQERPGVINHTSAYFTEPTRRLPKSSSSTGLLIAGIIIIVFLIVLFLTR
jgi:hypothetical protein